MIQRIIRAMRFDPNLFREVSANPALNPEAVLIALVVALLEGAGYSIAAKNALTGFLAGFTLSLLAGWLLWALLSTGIANRLGERATFFSMARPLAYAGLPRVLALFGFLSCAGWMFRAAGWLLVLLMGAAALRALLGLDRARALVAAFMGLAVYLLLSLLTGYLTNTYALFGI